MDICSRNRAGCFSRKTKGEEEIPKLINQRTTDLQYFPVFEQFLSSTYLLGVRWNSRVRFLLVSFLLKRELSRFFDQIYRTNRREGGRMTSTKPTTCKEAIRLWEEENGQEASSAKQVILSFQWPPIEKMDNALSTLVNCEKLSLSTNMIEKIAGRYPLSGLLLYSSFRSYTSYYTYLILRGALFVEGKFLPFSSIIFSSVNALINQPLTLFFGLSYLEGMSIFLTIEWRYVFSSIGNSIYRNWGGSVDFRESVIETNAQE